MQHAVASTEAWLVIRVRTRRCALPIRLVIETMRPLPIDRVGRTQVGVLGVATIRGTSVPVVDAAALFGESGIASRFVTVRVGERVVALAVDEVVGVRDVPSAAWEALPPLVAAANDGVVQAMTRADAGLVLALDAARVLPAEDGAP